MPASQSDPGASAPAGGTGREAPGADSAAPLPPFPETRTSVPPDSAAAGDAPRGAQQRASGAARAPSLLTLVQELLRELPGIVSDRVHLLSLEIKRAALALAWIAALGFATLILGLTIWFALWAGIATGAVQAGLHWGWALAIVLVVNAGAAAFAVMRILKLVPLLSLPATMRRLSVPQGGPRAPAPSSTSSTMQGPGHDRPEPVVGRAAARP